MTSSASESATIGWIGTGRMGFPMAALLLKAGHDVRIYNRTRAKAEPLAAYGGEIADTPAALADREVVFTMVAGPDDLRGVIAGLLSDGAAAPRIVVDCSSVDEAASRDARRALAARGAAFLAAPVSGNGKVVEAGRLTVVASGPRPVFDAARPMLDAIAPRGAIYVGEGDLARTCKICHNVMLGVVTQCMAEITVLAERAGVSRQAFLAFMNASVMGSTFTRYKTPSFVNLDYTPTFTPPLLRKDLDLGLALGKTLDVPMPVTAIAREIVSTVVGRGHTECDFAVLLRHAAEAAGHELVSENAETDDGLSG